MRMDDNRPPLAPLIAFGIVGLIVIALVIRFLVSFHWDDKTGRFFSDMTHIEDPLTGIESKIDQAHGFSSEVGP